MDPDETAAAQLRLDLVHCLPREINFTSRVNADVVALGLQPFDARRLQQHGVAARLHHKMGLWTGDRAQQAGDALAEITGIGSGEPLAGARHGVLKTMLRERLQ